MEENKELELVTDAAEEKTEEQKIEEMRSFYVKHANDLKEKIKVKWFTIDQLAAKANISRPDAAGVLLQMVNFKLAVSKSEFIKKKKILLFKFDIEQEELKLLIQAEIDHLKLKISYLEGKLKKML